MPTPDITLIVPYFDTHPFRFMAYAGFGWGFGDALCRSVVHIAKAFWRALTIPRPSRAPEALSEK